MNSAENRTDMQDSRVVPFRRTARDNPRAQGGASGGPIGAGASSTGLERYERSDDVEDDYRHRMIVNFTALAICIGLGAAGVWVAINIADLRRNQDCVLAGRKNCAALSIPMAPRLDASREEQAAPKPLPGQ